MNDSNIQQMIAELPVQNKTKDILIDICNLQPQILRVDAQNEQNKTMFSLIENLVESLKSDFMLKEDLVHEKQIQIVSKQIQSNLTEWKMKWWSSNITNENVDGAFEDLIAIVKCGFEILNLPFQNLLVMNSTTY